MITLYTTNEYENSKQTDLLKLQCDHCHKEFLRNKKRINHTLRNKKPNNNTYCSNTCRGLAKRTRLKINCKVCNKEIYKTPYQIAWSKKFNVNCCSLSCAAKYRNAHKTWGTRRSKLEIWIEKNLNSKYPDLKISYNDVTAINSELDIYIKSLNLAFEINGIFHYKPIFGDDKLTKIQKRDENKLSSCYKNNIALCVIDISQQKYFKEKTSFKYLNIISNIIDDKNL